MVPHQKEFHEMNSIQYFHSKMWIFAFNENSFFHFFFCLNLIILSETREIFFHICWKLFRINEQSGWRAKNVQTWMRRTSTQKLWMKRNENSQTAIEKWNKFFISLCRMKWMQSKNVVTFSHLLIFFLSSVLVFSFTFLAFNVWRFVDPCLPSSFTFHSRR